jgi:hypothetical protein
MTVEEEVIIEKPTEGSDIAYALTTIGERVTGHITEMTDAYTEWLQMFPEAHNEAQSIEVTEIVFFTKQDTYVIRFSIIGTEAQKLFENREFLEERVFFGDLEIIDNSQCGENENDFVLALALKDPA